MNADRFADVDLGQIGGRRELNAELADLAIDILCGLAASGR